MSFLGTIRRRENWPLVLIPLMLLLWARFAAPTIGRASFESVALPSSPYLGALPSGTAGQTLSKRVVIIVADGLRVDSSRQMPTLNQLRTQGADRILRVGEPSLSLPGWTVIGTGAWQEQSGITSNFSKERIRLDSIFLAAKRKGLTTAIVGSSTWGQLYTDGVDTLRVVADPDGVHQKPSLASLQEAQLSSLALDVLKTQPDLFLIHLPGPDNVSHGFGGASKETMTIVQQLDRELSQILSSVDLRETAVFFTSDHGHIDSGGHGGWEPIVLDVPFVGVGQGIRPGQYAPASQADIAPTIAVLLGTPIPAHNQGIALFDELDASEALKAARAIDNAKQISTRYEDMLQVIGDSRVINHRLVVDAEGAFKSGNLRDAMATAEKSIEYTKGQWENGRTDRLNSERVSRLLSSLPILLIFALYLIWWKRNPWSRIQPIIGGAVYFAIWYFNYLIVQRLYFSISLFNEDDNITLFLTQRVIEAMIALVISTLVVGLLSRRLSKREIIRNGVNTLFVIAFILGMQILLFYILWDSTFPWYMPDLSWGFKYYLDIFQTTVFWPVSFLPLAVLLPLLALIGAWISSRAEQILRGILKSPSVAL